MANIYFSSNGNTRDQVTVSQPMLVSSGGNGGGDGGDESDTDGDSDDHDQGRPNRNRSSSEEQNSSASTPVNRNTRQYYRTNDVFNGMKRFDF